jgi:hypothetical protein
LSIEAGKTTVAAESAARESTIEAQWPIFGPAALAPCVTSLSRTVWRQWGQVICMVSSSGYTTSSSFTHMSRLHLGQALTTMDDASTIPDR